MTDRSDAAPPAMREAAVKRSAPYLLTLAGRLTTALHWRDRQWNGVHPAESFILLELWQEQPLSQSELSRRLELGHATVRQTVKRLERNGLVTRGGSESDRRRVMIGLTEAGRALREPMLAASDALVARYDAALGGEAIGRLIDTLHVLLDDLRRG